MIRVTQLTKTYDDAPILRGIDLDLFAGDFIAVVGGSGSGKSTLLRCLGLQENWDKGKLMYKETDLVNASALVKWKYKKDWAVLEQNPQLLPKQTAYRNVLRARFRDFPLWRMLIGGKASQDEHMRALDYLEQVGLLDKAFQKVETLSGGEKQRVGIAKVLCQGAKIIIADSPVSNLDPHSAERVLQDLKKLCERDKLLILCTFPGFEMAEKYANRILGLVDGRIEFDVRGRRLTTAEKIKLS